MNKIDSRIEESPIFNAAVSVVKVLREAGFIAYFVGGAPRDMLLGKMPKDIDIVTSARPDTVSSIFPRSHQIGASFGVITVVENDIPFEVATFREDREYLDGRHPEEVRYTDKPELDATRRDFTINGMFYDPLSSEILDFVGGRKDLARGVLRTIGKAEERFSEDYLRILRAVRFCCRYRFALDDDARRAISKLKDKICLLSVERIRDEINKMLTDPEPVAALEMLMELGLLEVFLPEVSRLKQVTQPEKFHPEGDVFKHVLLMFKYMSAPSVDLAWSVLLHDVGKADTAFVGEDGIEHFYGHEQTGSVIAEQILRKYKFPGKSIERIVKAVKDHMRYAHVNQMRTSKWKRLMAEPGFPMELELHRLDCMACHKKLGNYILLLDRFREMKDEPKLPEPLITGRDLLRLGFQPGPDMGKILKTVVDMQLEGQLNTRQEALDYSTQLFNSKGLGNNIGRN